MLDLGYGDAQERDEAEREDETFERNRAIETAQTGHRFCPQCAVEVLTNRRSQCVWDDGPTLLHPPVIRPGATRTRVSRRRGGAGTSGDTTEESAA